MTADKAEALRRMAQHAIRETVRVLEAAETACEVLDRPDLRTECRYLKADLRHLLPERENPE